MDAYILPISAVINWYTEKVSLAVFRIGAGITLPFGKIIFWEKSGNNTSTITIPIKAALHIEPTTMPVSI